MALSSPSPIPSELLEEEKGKPTSRFCLLQNSLTYTTGCEYKGWRIPSPPPPGRSQPPALLFQLW